MTPLLFCHPSWSWMYSSAVSWPVPHLHIFNIFNTPAGAISTKLSYLGLYHIHMTPLFFVTLSSPWFTPLAFVSLYGICMPPHFFATPASPRFTPSASVGLYHVFTIVHSAISASPRSTIWGHCQPVSYLHHFTFFLPPQHTIDLYSSACTTFAYFQYFFNTLASASFTALSYPGLYHIYMTSINLFFVTLASCWSVLHLH